jgi:uncharacterized protein (DUF2062 family)
MLQKIKILWAKLKHAHSTPFEVAGGVALGIFVGMSPFPLQNILTIALAWVFRMNVVAAIIGVNFHLVFFPVIVLQYLLEYKVGVLLLRMRIPRDPHVDWMALYSLDQWLSGGRVVRRFIKELILGWLALGVPMSLATFFFVWREAKLWKKLPALKATEIRELTGESKSEPESP